MDVGKLFDPSFYSNISQEERRAFALQVLDDSVQIVADYGCLDIGPSEGEAVQRIFHRVCNDLYVKMVDAVAVVKYELEELQKSLKKAESAPAEKGE